MAKFRKLNLHKPQTDSVLRKPPDFSAFRAKDIFAGFCAIFRHVVCRRFSHTNPSCQAGAALALCSCYHLLENIISFLHLAMQFGISFVFHKVTAALWPRHRGKPRPCLWKKAEPRDSITYQKKKCNELQENHHLRSACRTLRAWNSANGQDGIFRNSTTGH